MDILTTLLSAFAGALLGNLGGYWIADRIFFQRRLQENDAHLYSESIGGRRER